MIRRSKTTPNPTERRIRASRDAIEREQSRSRSPSRYLMRIRIEVVVSWFVAERLFADPAARSRVVETGLVVLQLLFGIKLATGPDVEPTQRIDFGSGVLRERRVRVDVLL